MRKIQALFYRLAELFNNLTGNTVAAQYYAAKREDVQ